MNNQGHWSFSTVGVKTYDLGLLGGGANVWVEVVHMYLMQVYSRHILYTNTQANVLSLL